MQNYNAKKYLIEIVSRDGSGTKYRLDNVKNYRIEQSVDVPADAFDITIPNKHGFVSKYISPGDYFNFFLGPKQIMRGIIDDFTLSMSNTNNDVRINGRDFMSKLLDNDASPKTYYNLGLSDYLGKVMPGYGISATADSNEKFDKIVIDPGDTEYSVIEKLCDKRNLIPIFDSDGTFRCTKIVSHWHANYHFSNDYPNTIKFTDIDINISNDIVSQVEVYAVNPNTDVKDLSEEEKKKKNIYGNYKDANLKTQKKKVMNMSDVNKTEDANRLAKQEFFKINKNAFSITLTTSNLKGDVIPINTAVRVSIAKYRLDCLLYTDSVEYVRDKDKDYLRVNLKLMPGIPVKLEGKDIPALPVI